MVRTRNGIETKFLKKPLSRSVSAETDYGVSINGASLTEYIEKVATQKKQKKSPRKEKQVKTPNPKPVEKRTTRSRRKTRSGSVLEPLPAKFVPPEEKTPKKRGRGRPRKVKTPVPKVQTPKPKEKETEVIADPATLMVPLTPVHQINLSRSKPRSTLKFKTTDSMLDAMRRVNEEFEKESFGEPDEATENVNKEDSDEDEPEKPLIHPKKPLNAVVEFSVGKELDEDEKEEQAGEPETLETRIEAKIAKFCPKRKDLVGRKRKLREKEREELNQWSKMREVEITQDMKDDFEMIQLRNYADPKRFYRKSDFKEMPKVFQVGTIVSGTFESKKQKIGRRKRKKRIADEILADEKIVAYTDRVLSN